MAPKTIRPCSITGCPSNAWSRDMCRKHYDHWRNSTGYRKPSREERFWAKVLITDSCWIWLGPKDRQGYGRFRVSPTSNGPAHRYAYELLVGPIPDGLTLDHVYPRCQNKACVRPTHLEPVTGAVNYQRFKATRTHCKRGHEFTPENTYIDKIGARQCRKCSAEKQARYRAARRADTPQA